MSNSSCPQCHKEFKPTRKWQKFCSPKCRNEHWQAKNVRYLNRERIPTMQAPSQADRDVYNNWLKTRPAAVQEAAKLVDPWKLYKLKSTGQVVRLAAFSEEQDGSITLRVDLPRMYNDANMIQDHVFGIPIDDLVEFNPN